MLYPILHRLEKKGLIGSYWGTADTGRRRKYYRLLETGLTVLEQQRKHWKDIHAMLENLDGGKLCFS
jgi:DNA-binding PadR family transcriptional regulator